MSARLPVAVAAAPEADFAEIAAALGVSKPSIRMRAKRKNWPYVLRKVMGGQAHHFSLATLPRLVARKVQAARGVAAMRGAELDPAEFTLVVDGDVFLVKRIGGAS